MVQICSICCINKRSHSPRHIFRSSGLFLDYPNTFSRLSRHLQDHPETFQIIQIQIQIIHTLFRVSRYIFRLYGHSLHHRETFQFIRTLCILSGYFVQYSHIFKIFGNSSANNELVAKTFRIRKNFPVSIADALTGFF